MTMSFYQFYEFQFNREKYQLSKNEVQVTIRPKTALVLGYLIEHRDSIVSKDDLFNAVWQTTHVQNHTLFQVISEIRKLSSKDLIRTQPNRGYQWIATTSAIVDEHREISPPLKKSIVVSKTKQNKQNKQKSRNQQLAMAASMTMLLCSSFFLGQWSTQKNVELSKGGLVKNSLSNGSYSLPAVNAYAKGVLAFEEGKYNQAQQWFDFSLLENPSSVQSKLMLAESLFKQENVTRAQGVAFELLDTLSKTSYHYSSTADLLSRIYAQQGLVFDALAYAISGANSLENSGAFCSIDVSDQRIEKLAQQLVDDKSLKTDKASLLAGYYKQSKQGNGAVIGNKSNISTANSLCEKVSKTLETAPIVLDDTSACVKQESSVLLLSYNYQSDIYQIKGAS